MWIGFTSGMLIISCIFFKLNKYIYLYKRVLFVTRKWITYNIKIVINSYKFLFFFFHISCYNLRKGHSWERRKRHWSRLLYTHICSRLHSLANTCLGRLSILLFWRFLLDKKGTNKIYLSRKGTTNVIIVFSAWERKGNCILHGI